MLEIGISRNCFPKGKPVDQVHESVDRRRHRSMVDHGHCLGGGSPENGRNGAPVRGTSPRLRKKGEGMAVSLIDCKRGRRRDGHGRAMVGNNWRRSCLVVMAEGCSSPFYSGRGGARWGEGGGNGRPIMALMPLMAGRLDEGLRGEIKRGNQGRE
jgi:hypothetical protein